MLERGNIVVEAYGDGLLNDDEFVLLCDSQYPIILKVH